MTIKIEYLVEKMPRFSNRIILQLETHQGVTMAYLTAYLHGILEKPLLLGSVKKQNNRGVTICSPCLTTTNINIFYSNGDFELISEIEYIKRYGKNE